MSQLFLTCNMYRHACLLTAALSSFWGATVVEAQNVRTTSVPRNYVLFSRTTKGRKVPKFVIRVDKYIYPSSTSYRQFLMSGAVRTPEGVAARLFDSLIDPQAKTEDYLALYTSAKRSNAKDRKRLSDAYLAARPDTRKLGEPKFEARYDFGRYSQIDVSFPNACRDFIKSKSGGLARFGVVAVLSSIERTGNGAHLSGDLGAPGDAALLGQFAITRTPFDGKIALPYSLRVSNDSPAAKNVHPVDVFFDGTPLSVPLDGRTRTASPAVNFLQHAAQVIRGGKIADILALWDTPSAEKIRASLQPKAFTLGNYEEEKARLLDTSRRVAFVMEFDEGAAIFLRHAKASVGKPLFEPVFVFKQKEGYKLSFETKSDLRKGNIGQLFRGADFQKYLLKITTR